MSQGQGDIQERIAAARREADSLKERIRAKRESSADTSRQSLSPIPALAYSHQSPLYSARYGGRGRRPPPYRHATPPRPQRPSRKDLRNALGDRQEASRIGFPGWETHRLGRLHDKQSPRHPLAIELGHDLRLLAIWQLRRLRRSRQHLLHIQPSQQGRQRHQGR